MQFSVIYWSVHKTQNFINSLWVNFTKKDQSLSFDIKSSGTIFSLQQMLKKNIKHLICFEAMDTSYGNCNPMLI